MTNEVMIPNWVKQVAGVQRKRRRANTRITPSSVRVQHEVEVDPFTMTFSEIRQQVWSATPKSGEALKSLGMSEAAYRRSLSEVFDKLDDFSTQLWKLLCADAKREFERTDLVSELPVGPVIYHLRNPLKALIAPSADQRWEVSLNQFHPRFIGKGESIAIAQRDFLNQVHATFQSLVRRRPFQMDEKQRTDWHTLERLIDVDAYWDCVPVTLLEIGVLSAITDAGCEVIWLDGVRKEVIPIERTLPEFAEFRPEQWFEALVERQPGSYELLKLRYVRPIEPIRDMSPEEFRQWISTLPSADDVPKSETDWNDL